MLNRHWSRIREFLERLWAELLNLLGWRRQHEQAPSAEQGVSPAIAARTFAAYENPFFSGGRSGCRRLTGAVYVRGPGGVGPRAGRPTAPRADAARICAGTGTAGSRAGERCDLDRRALRACRLLPKQSLAGIGASPRTAVATDGNGGRGVMQETELSGAQANASERPIPRWL